MGWKSLTDPWRACFEEAWAAFCAGSNPVGAALANRDDEVVFRGRNRINEMNAPANQICNTRMAHAEVNVLMQVKGVGSRILADHILYATTEPCVLCFGAVVMSGVRTLQYAASDPVAGGTDMNRSGNSFIRTRNIDVQQAPKLLGNVQRVIRTVYVLQSVDTERGNELLKAEGAEYRNAIFLGRRWFQENKLQRAIKHGVPFGEVFDDIVTELDPCHKEG